jgi:uncharacterized protein with HEPN domain
VKDDRPYLLHIRESIRSIEQYTRGGRDEFFAERIIQDAVIRNLEVIGEAAKQLSEPTRLAEPSIPWKSIAGMRDVLIHHYFGVDLDTVWNVVEQNLGPLHAAVQKVLSERDICE